MTTKAQITQNSNNLADDMVKAGPLLRITNTFAYVAGIKDGLAGNEPAWPEHPLYWDYHLGHKLGIHMRSNPGFDFVQRAEEPKPEINAMFIGKTRLQILESFGYTIKPRQDGEDGFVFCIEDDPEAFRITGVDPQELEVEAYAFLCDEVDPNLYTMPTF